MSPLSPASAQAIARLRAYVPPPTLYQTLPTSRRAAVLLLLFADRRGDLRVVLTVRSAMLKTFAGHVAFPGGKADSPHETPAQTARREAFEEIGLPLEPLPHSFTIEHLAELPLSLAATNLGVRPCVALLNSPTGGNYEPLVPRLDPNEVQSVFAVPLERFLRVRYGADGERVDPESVDGVPWYTGSWVPWNGSKWKMNEFQAPVWSSSSLTRHRVWGMTARILIDAARIAYGRDPEFSFVDRVGDEDMIKILLDKGEMGKEKDRAESSMIYNKAQLARVKKREENL
ncbi:8-oxo-dGTP diphosphatase [Maublancomyces gigas]|uniref:8-oxo-dGTP diphosphatase n=1 Tax=Discina gigas TaxID=1032678 RepID=A0ABR3GUL1_9PEZI